MSLAPIDYYDKTKWDIDEERPLLQREHKAIDTIRKRVPAGQTDIKILDIGCGDGQFLRELDAAIKQPWDYHGVDYSEYKLKRAGSLPYTFRHCNLEVGIPYEPNTFDVVYSGEVIEHIYNPDFMLEECRRVLKPGGIVIISTPNLQAWYNRALFAVGIQPLFYEVSTKSTHIGAGALKPLKKQTVPVGHLRVFNRRGLTDLVENEGFEPLSMQGAKFQSLPKAVQSIDNLFNLRPSLASNLIITARKPVSAAS